MSKAQQAAPVLPKSVPAKLAAYVEHWDDERSIGNSLIVSLKAGRRFTTDPRDCTHVEGFDTVKDATRALRATLPCICSQCYPRRKRAN